tara:strand:- start:4070 stop:4489 length:420 start_codon:yes stop_codon:yes gene_type:complete
MAPSRDRWNYAESDVDRGDRVYTSDKLTSNDVKVLHWAEKVLTPLLVTGIIGLSTCAISLTNSVSALQTHNDIEAEARKSDSVQQQKNADGITAALKDQQELKAVVVRISTHQEHLQQDVKAIKLQNIEILKRISEISR